MGLSDLRRYDVQARYALALSLLSTAPLVVAGVMIARNYNHDLGQIVYGEGGAFLKVFLGCVGVSGVVGAIAFVLGWASAGQRRNDRPTQSWVGFFVGGLVMTIALIMMIAFIMLRLKQPMS